MSAEFADGELKPNIESSSFTVPLSDSQRHEETEWDWHVSEALYLELVYGDAKYVFFD